MLHPLFPRMFPKGGAGHDRGSQPHFRSTAIGENFFRPFSLRLEDRGGSRKAKNAAPPLVEAGRSPAAVLTSSGCMSAGPVEVAGIKVPNPTQSYAVPSCEARKHSLRSTQTVSPLTSKISSNVSESACLSALIFS